MDSLFDLETVRSALRLSAPLVLTAMGGVLSERSGVVNIGLEGQMLAGAFGAYAVAVVTGSPWLGVAAGLTAGGLFGLLHAVVSVKFKADQVVSGVAVNLLAAGGSIYLMRSLMSGEPPAPMVADWPLTPLAGVPVIGSLLANLSPFVFLALLLPFVVHGLLAHTLWGLQVRAVGEGLRTARLIGLPVHAIRIGCVSLSGVLAGLAGSYLSISQLNVFTENMSAGRGFIALAAVIFGRWTPLGAAAAALGFGLLDAVQQRLQGAEIGGVTLPSELMLCMPYVLTVVVLAGCVGRTRAPSGLGKLED